MNGEQVTAFSHTTYPPQDTETYINDNIEHRVGQYIGNGQGSFFNGYLAEYYFIDGRALGPEYFGETNVATNQWRPKSPSDIKQGVTFGKMGFYLPFNNAALDYLFPDSATHKPHTMTAIGNAHTDTTIKKFGTASMQLDGTNSQVTTPDSVDWTPAHLPFTIDCWIYTTDSSPSTSQYIFTTWDLSSAPNCSLLTWLSSDLKVNFRWQVSSTGHSAVSNAAISANAWHHLAFERIGDVGYIYVDGVRQTDTISNAGTVNDSSRGVSIGMLSVNGGTNSNWFEGYIDEVRFSNIARWSGSSFAVPTEPYEADAYTKLLLHCDGANDGTTFTDSADAPPRHEITKKGNVHNTRVSDHTIAVFGDLHAIGPKVGSSAIAFDGTGDKLTVPDSSDFAFGTGAFTIECWINFTAIPSMTRFFHWHQDGSNRGGFQNTSSSGLQWFAESGGSSVIDFTEGSNSIVFKHLDSCCYCP